MTQALFPQIKPLSAKPTPAELREFSLAVRAAVTGLTAVQAQVVEISKQVSSVVDSISQSPSGSTGDGTTEVIEAPETLQGLEIIGAFSAIMAKWLPPSYLGHAYTEIWRAQVNDLGQAVEVGREAFYLWTDDTLPSSLASETYYYWGRHVNKNGDVGAFNAVEGTPGSTATDPGYVLSLLQEQITESQLYSVLNDRIDLIDTPGTGLVDGLAQEILDRGTAVASEAQARQTADGALAESLDLVQAEVADPVTGLAAAHSAVVSESQARTNADSALAQDITTVTSTINDPATGLSAAHSAVQNEATARADADSTIAQNVSTLQTTVGDNTTSIQTQQTSVDGLEAQITTKIDNNGFPSGYGLASEPINGVPFSEFLALVDRFAIINPAADVRTVSSITRSGSTVTVTTSTAHGLAVSDRVVMTGADQREYNGGHQVATVLSTTQFTYTITGTPVTPATVAEGFPGLRCAKAMIPFVVQDGSVYMDTALVKNLTATNFVGQKIVADEASVAFQLSASKILAGVISVSNVFVGASSRIHIDGTNEQITVSDGNRVRVRLGKIGTDWAIEIFDAAGNTIVSAGGGVPSTAVTGLGSLSTLNGFTVANISSYFENAAIGEALLGNAAVTTLKIGPNAVTVPVGAYTAGNIALGTSWVTIQQATINALGQPVSIDYASAYYISWSSTGYVTGELYCRLVYSTGTEIIPEYMVERQFGSSTATLRGAVSFSTMIFPAGSVTVYLQLRLNTTSYLTANKNAFYRYLGLIGMKR